jgi:predicted nucleic acid-binding protein
MQKEERSKNGEAKIYVDTCILQGAMSGRKKGQDTSFIEKAREKGWKVYTSIHTLMEMYDIAKDRTFFIKSVLKGWVDVNTFLRERWRPSLNKAELDEATNDLNNFFLKYKFIEFLDMYEEVWKDVKTIVETSNLHSSDAIHLAMASMYLCDVLVTHDEFFIKEGNNILKEGKQYDSLRICDVDKVEETIHEVLSKKPTTKPGDKV